MQTTPGIKHVCAAPLKLVPALVLILGTTYIAKCAEARPETVAWVGSHYGGMAARPHTASLAPSVC